MLVQKSFIGNRYLDFYLAYPYSVCVFACVCVRAYVCVRACMCVYVQDISEELVPVYL